jgi:serine kinase of HPr protein (carbohydrate metabolism regulator)
MNISGVAQSDEPAANPGPYIHATAVAIGEAGILIRGPSGAGKSRLALELVAEARRRGLFGRLVGDDRVTIAAHGGRLVAIGHPAIAGQIESRGEGILNLSYERAVVIRLVIDLGEDAAARLPPARATTSLHGLALAQFCLGGPGPQRAEAVIEHLLRMGNG